MVQKRKINQASEHPTVRDINPIRAFQKRGSLG